MERRTFLCGLTLGALATPLAADAQETAKVARIGLLVAGSESLTRGDIAVSTNQDSVALQLEPSPA